MKVGELTATSTVETDKPTIRSQNIHPFPSNYLFLAYWSVLFECSLTQNDHEAFHHAREEEVLLTAFLKFKVKDKSTTSSSKIRTKKRKEER